MRQCWVFAKIQMMEIQMTRMTSELYTPPLIPIGFLLDSYIPHAFPVHSTHSYVFPGVLVES